MESSMESNRNTIEKTMNKALSPGASQHFCEVHRATFGPTVLMGSLGLTWPLPFCLSTCFLKEQELEDSGKCKELSVWLPTKLFSVVKNRSRCLPSDLLVSLLSSTKLHFCCSCIALCPRLLAELLGGQTWLRILSVDS